MYQYNDKINNYYIISVEHLLFSDVVFLTHFLIDGKECKISDLHETYYIGHVAKKFNKLPEKFVSLI